MSPPDLLNITLSQTEREIACQFLSLGIAEIVARVNRGQRQLEGRLKAARRVLLKLREAK